MRSRSPWQKIKNPIRQCQINHQKSHNLRHHPER